MTTELVNTSSRSEAKIEPDSERGELHAELLKLQVQAAAQVKPPALSVDRKAIAERAAMGRPLLAFDEVPLEWTLFRDLFDKAIAVLGLASPRDDLQTLARAWYESRLPPAMSQEQQLLELAIHGALDPFLAACHETLIKTIGREESQHSYCLICGEPPSVTFVDPARGERWLICCDTEWAREEIECSFCGNEENVANVFFEDDKEQYRLYVCERCKRYLKSVDPRRGPHTAFPTVERPFTLGMDLRPRAREGTPSDDKSREPATPDELAHA